MNQMLRTGIAAILVFCILMTATALANTSRYLRIASGDVASGLFTLAGSVAGAISNPAGARSCTDSHNCNTIGLIAVAQTSSSANAALLKLRGGGVDAAVIPASLAYAAYTGSSQRLISPWNGMRLLANLSVRPILVVARADIKAQTLASINGWRIATGPRDSDASADAAMLLAALGVTRYQNINNDLGLGAAEMITGNMADAVVLMTDELPAPERAAIAAGTLRLIDPGKGDLERATSQYPFLERRVIDPGTGENYTTLGSGSVLLVRADLPAPVALTILTRLWSNPDDTFNRQDAGSRGPVPLHETAENFYKEHTTHDQ